MGNIVEAFEALHGIEDREPCCGAEGTPDCCDNRDNYTMHSPDIKAPVTCCYCAQGMERDGNHLVCTGCKACISIRDLN